MQYSFLTTIAAVAAIASAKSTITQLETVTSHNTVDVTITSCSDNACTTTVKVDSTTVVTTTVNGVETIYTTICPESKLTSTAAPASKLASTAAPASSMKPSSTSKASVATVLSGSSSDTNIYVDITSTPTVTVSKGVLSTAYKQSSFTTYYNGTSSLSPAVTNFENNAAKNAVFGFVGAAGIIAALL